MEQDKNDPLRFVSYLFELAVWPFQTAAKYSATKLPLHDQDSMVVFLYPAILLSLPLCLLISLLAIP